MGKKRWSVVAFLTIIFMAVTAKLWLEDKPIRVSFISDSQTDIEYEVFYSDKKNGSFDDALSTKKKVEKGQHAVIITLPVERIYLFKLALSKAPQKVIVSDIKIDGWGSIEITDESPLVFNDDVDLFDFHKNVLTISSAKGNPEITYNKRFKLKAAKVPDLCLFIIFFTLSFLLAYKLVQYLAKFKIEEHHSRIDIVFLSCFFIILFIPMSYISKDKISRYENRMLAKYHSLFENDKINTKFGEQFENWYNDRFFGRRLFIKIDETTKGLFVPGNEKVLVGKDNWLFFKKGNSLNNYANKTEMSEEQMAHGLKYLQDIDNWCRQRNKKFYYLLIPDKNKVYGEYYRYVKKVKPDSQGMGWQFVNYVKKNSDINIIYLYDTLIENKDKEFLFWKNDTHWNAYGGYIGYLELMKHIANDFEIEALDISKWQEAPYSGGDLSKMYTPSAKWYKNVKYKTPILAQNAKCVSTDELSNPRIECENEKGKLRVFTLRDSFSGSLQQYYAETFKRTIMHWRYTLDESDLQEIEKNYDVVILENVERYLPKILDLSFPED